MGVSIVDQKRLYSATSENIGMVQAEPVSVRLPFGAFAVYEGKTAAVTASTSQWEDKSGNENHITLTDVTASDWSTDHLVCSGNLRTTSGTCGAANKMSLGSDYGYTFNALVRYDAAGAGADNSKGLDCIFALNINTDSKWTQLGFGDRSTNANKIMHAVNSGGWETQYSAAQSFAEDVPKLFTWVVGGTTCKIYLNATLIATLTLTKTMANTTPQLYFFAPNVITDSSSNIYNFLGDVYAMSVYDRALTEDEVARVRDYYLQQYKSSYTL